jgi:hypothetical protein
MKLTFEVFTQPQSLALERDLSELLQDDIVRENVEQALVDNLERFLGEPGVKVGVDLTTADPGEPPHQPYVRGHAPPKGKIPWISVDERLPDDRQRVLAWHTRRGKVGLHEFYYGWEFGQGGRVAYWDGVKDDDMDISHWSPEPEGPPEEEEE